VLVKREGWVYREYSWADVREYQMAQLAFSGKFDAFDPEFPPERSGASQDLMTI
jgi:hypothetical protein